MSMEFIPILLVVSLIAFITQFIDSAFGMGFGTITTPTLLILGYQPYEIVPAILLTNLLAGSLVSIFHSAFKNITLGKQSQVKEQKTRRKGNSRNKSHNNPQTIHKEVKKLKDYSRTDIDQEIKKGEKGQWRRKLAGKIDELTVDTKVIIILSSFAVLGTILASVISVVFQYSKEFNFAIKIYISVMILVIGITLLILRKRKFAFSWKKIIGLSALAGFNKGISGGGYGPLAVAGQILTGREGKRAIASTLFSETIATFVGATTYFLTHIFVNLSQNDPFSWEYLHLVPYLIIGAVLAAPLAAYFTNKMEGKWLERIVASVTMFLGVFSLIRVIFLYTDIWEFIPRFVEIIS
ncbi:MAG: TSUP family transporter [Candidatus Heimdallarchaeota archaeon]|nr:TSUP family transporter [Candidatus Heimdallarchaeota archaeon]